MLSVTCPSCRANIHILDQLAGKTIRCKQCQQVFTVGVLPKTPEPKSAPPRQPPPIPDVPVVHPIAKAPSRQSDPLREGLQSRPGRVPPPVLKPVKSTPPPARRNQAPAQSPPASTSSHAWLIGGGAVGALLLVGFGVALALILRNSGAKDSDSKKDPQVAQSLVDPVRESRREPATHLVREEIRPSPPARQEPPAAREEASPSPPSELAPKPPERAETKKEVSAPPAGGDNSGSIPAALLDHLKAATVFVKVDSKDFGASGSGFVMKVQGDTVYVVTNAHVIDPKIEIEITRPRGNGPMAGMPQMPRFGPPNFPRGPMGPRGPFGSRGPGMMQPPNFGPPQQQPGSEETQKIVVPFGNATISLVLGSGTKKERSYRAIVTASDRERDLAILKITGCKELPEPIDCTHALNLQETMPVYVFGFPFGEGLATNKGNPAITVGKGSVSSIRRNERDEITYVQIDGAINPGNSGGPVVDSQGRLVGVAVKTIRGAGIGLAIPADKLTSMLLNKPQAMNNPASPPRRIFEKQPRVFLSDLEEFDVRSGPWSFSKNGQLGDPENKIIQVNGYRSAKGLSMHPPDGGDYASACFRLGKQASLFRSEVALNDSTNLVVSAAVFEVWGDGKQLWQSKPVNQTRHSHRCRVDVSAVDVMELRVMSTGSHVGLHAVWYEPRLLEKPNTPDK